MHIFKWAPVYKTVVERLAHEKIPPSQSNPRLSDFILRSSILYLLNQRTNYRQWQRNNRHPKTDPWLNKVSWRDIVPYISSSPRTASRRRCQFFLFRKLKFISSNCVVTVLRVFRQKNIACLRMNKKADIFVEDFHRPGSSVEKEILWFSFMFIIIITCFPKKLVWETFSYIFLSLWRRCFWNTFRGELKLSKDPQTLKCNISKWFIIERIKNLAINADKLLHRFGSKWLRMPVAVPAVLLPVVRVQLQSSQTDSNASPLHKLWTTKEFTIWQEETQFKLTNGSSVNRSCNWVCIIWVGISFGDFVVQLQVALSGKIDSLCVLDWMAELRVESIFVGDVFYGANLISWINITEGPTDCWTTNNTINQSV